MAMSRWAWFAVDLNYILLFDAGGTFYVVAPLGRLPDNYIKRRKSFVGGDACIVPHNGPRRISHPRYAANTREHVRSL